MKRIPFFIFAVLILTSCQTLPVINQLSPSADARKSQLCPSPFVLEKYRFVHSIEVQMRGETQSAIIGVTVVDPLYRTVACAIMTAEGMVLFEAEAGAEIKIIRALPPFDSGSFAKNMIDDIRLIFFSPEGELKGKGTMADGATVCRYQEKRGQWIDVVGDNANDNKEIRSYSSCGSLKRHIKIKGAYQNVSLQAKELFNYSLTMQLIEAEPVNAELKQDEDKGKGE